MKISAKTEYACKALIELGLHWPNTVPLQINEIGARQRIPIKFLPHILIQLKQLGIVESIRGKTGGYRMVKSPENITLGAVYGHFEESLQSGHPGNKDFLQSVWQDIGRETFNRLDEINFAVICKHYRNANKTLMFDI